MEFFACHLIFLLFSGAFLLAAVWGSSEAPFVVLWMLSTDIVAILSAHVGNTNNGVLFAKACRATHNRWIWLGGGFRIVGVRYGQKKGAGSWPYPALSLRPNKTWHLDTIFAVFAGRVFRFCFAQIFWLSTFIVLRSAYYIWSFHVLPISFLIFFRFSILFIAVVLTILGLLVIRNEMFADYVSSSQKQKSFS